MEGITYTAAQQQSESPVRSPSSPQSTSSSPRRISRTASHNLSLDLSDLPPLITPSPPSNTLLITNLMDPTIFHPASLATIRSNISQTAQLYSFSPLKSMRRIIVSFYSTDDAIAIRQQLDGENILGARVRVFFGAETPVNVDEKDRHLQAPAAAKLFFISPPPSPPHGWEMRNEEPPNKDVHAEDLAVALAKLHAKTHAYGGGDDVDAMQISDDMGAMVSPVSPARTNSDDMAAGRQRVRSGSTTIVYHPEHHGGSPTLPAVMVEDTTYQPEQPAPDDGDKVIMAHTARPPVELMTS